MMKSMIRSAWLGAALALAAPGCAYEAGVDEADEWDPWLRDPVEVAPTVVGGRPAVGYRPAGYLMVGDTADYMGAACGATLLDPLGSSEHVVAVTAAHCVAPPWSNPAHVGMGLGEARGVGTPQYYATGVFVHPGYDGDGFNRYEHDLAVLVLSQTPTEPAARIAEPRAGTDYLAIGYGRTTEGGTEVGNGYTLERKSAVFRLDTVLPSGSLMTHGLDGGLCWGDSGGGLMEQGTNGMLGVLSDFQDVFVCKGGGNAMIHTSLSAHRSFIECVAKRGRELAPPGTATKRFDNVCGDAALSAKPMELAWERTIAGGQHTLSLRVPSAAPEVSYVKYFVDGYHLRTVRRGEASDFATVYSFSQTGQSRRLEVYGYQDGDPQPITKAIGLLDVVDGVGAYIRQIGARQYEVGIDGPIPPGAAYIGVTVDGYAVTDADPAAYKARISLQQGGAREFRISSHNADGSVRGYFNRALVID